MTGEGDRAISAPALAALRVAATTLHAVPGLRGRLRGAGGAVADIGRPGTPPEDPAPRLLSPCGFRAAVADAHRRTAQGVGLAVRGVPGDPVIDIAAPVGGRSFAGGIHRVPCAGRWLYAAALCGDVGRFVPLVAEVVADVAAETGADLPGRLGLRPDGLLDTVLCFVEVEAGVAPDVQATALLGALLARCTVEELCAVPVARR